MEITVSSDEIPYRIFSSYQRTIWQLLKNHEFSIKYPVISYKNKVFSKKELEKMIRKNNW
jgi:hypothetical protein